MWGLNGEGVLICPDCRNIERRIHRRIAIIQMEESGISFVAKVESEAIEANILSKFYEIKNRAGIYVTCENINCTSKSVNSGFHFVARYIRIMQLTAAAARNSQSVASFITKRLKHSHELIIHFMLTASIMTLTMHFCRRKILCNLQNSS